MKTYHKCIPCFYRQVSDAAKLAGLDKDGQEQAKNMVEKALADFPMESTPPEMARAVYGAIHDLNGGEDVYRALKEKSNQMALKLYPGLKQMVGDSRDPLASAARVAVAGNVIDYGIPHLVDIEQEFRDTLSKDFAIFDIEAFRKAIKEANSILYLLDNAGEIVFDKILVEAIGKDVVCAVRGTHIINDVTMSDALDVGLDKVCKVMSSGSDIPGTRPERCSGEFLGYFNNADLIISKGQGNFETLSDESKPIFFIFKAKCEVVAEHIGCDMGDIILKKSNNYPPE